MYSENEKRRIRRVSRPDFFPDTTWSDAKDGFFESLIQSRFNCTILDICEGGLGFLTDSLPDTGQYVDVLIGYKEYKAFSIRFRVRYTHAIPFRIIENDQPSGETTLFRVGCELDTSMTNNIELFRKACRRAETDDALERS